MPQYELRKKSFHCNSKIAKNFEHICIHVYYGSPLQVMFVFPTLPTYLLIAIKKFNSYRRKKLEFV